MTQGTKIGLLVSLAFLIVVFVLLSDHAVSSNDVRPAPVTVAAPTVAKGLTVPGVAEPDATPAALRVEANIAPAEQVPTVLEMAQQPSLTGSARVAVGPAPVRPVEISAANHVPTDIRVSTPAEISPGASVMVLGELPDNVRSEVVPVAAIGASPAMMSVIEQPAPARKQHDYKAMPGDTVSRIARKYYGSDSKANCALIIAANPSLKANPNKIVVGKTYVVPMKEAPVTAAATVTPPATASAVPANAPAPAAATVVAAQIAPAAAAVPTTTVQPAPAPAASRTYVVKSGDSLWKIANSQCKDPNAMAAIRSLNKEVLKKGDALSVGMKLRLPN